MKIEVYNSLLHYMPDTNIRWPGADLLVKWRELEAFAVMSINICEDKILEIIANYSASPIILQRIGLSLNNLEIGTDGPGYSRFSIARLLLREWAKILHNDRIDIVTSDEPAPKNRIRSYKGLLHASSRQLAHSFDQIEIDMNPNLSILLNRAEFNSESPIICFLPLGDTFRSFGVYDWPKTLPKNILLNDIVNTYGEQRNIWRWNIIPLLPIICENNSSLFFLQGVANNTNIELVIYLPLKQLDAHLRTAAELFAAEIVLKNN